MRTYDLSPLFRSSVGFDRMTRVLESALKVDDSALSYPPYNIEKLSDDDRITYARSIIRTELSGRQAKVKQLLNEGGWIAAK